MNREVFEGKLISDSGHFSSYEGHKEHGALDGWMLARAPASPALGLHHHGPLL